MAGMKLSDLDFARLLPVFMRDDLAVQALSRAVDKLLGDPENRLRTLSTWGQTDKLTEAELDELAWEYDVDWYDTDYMSIEEKRATIEDALKIKRQRGTKWAVERLISAYFGEGRVLEWFEVDGQPYTFYALTTNPDIIADNYTKFINAVKAAKNERSHLVGVFYYWPQGSAGVEVAPEVAGYLYDFTKAGTRHKTATLGALIRAGIEVEPETEVFLYVIPETGDATSGTWPAPALSAVGIGTRTELSPSAAPTAYNFSKVGATKCGTWPRRATKYADIKVNAKLTPRAAQMAYTIPETGDTTSGTWPQD